MRAASAPVSRMSSWARWRRAAWISGMLPTLIAGPSAGAGPGRPGLYDLAGETKEGAMSDLPPEIDTSRPHSARMYDYFIGGKNHFAADRATADEVLKHSPYVPVAARENRAFLRRAVS